MVYIAYGQGLVPFYRVREELMSVYIELALIAADAFSYIRHFFFCFFVSRLLMLEKF